MAGQALLIFTSATAGNINFYYPAAYPVGIRNPSFPATRSPTPPPIF
jgi:hypothetical protein